MRRIIETFMMLTVCLYSHASLPDSLLTISKAYSYNYASLDRSLDIIHTLRERGELPAWKLMYVEGDLYRNTCHYHSAIECFQEALATSDVQRDIRLQMTVWRAIMNCHDMLMDDILLVDDLFKLRKCALECGDVGHKAIADFVVGKRIHLHGEKEKGYQACLKALDELKKSDVTKKMYALRMCYGVLVKLYRSDRLYDKAMAMSLQQEKYVRTVSPDDIPGELNFNLHNVYAQRASVLAEAGRLGEADEAYDLWKQTMPGNPYDNREVLSYLLISNRLEEALNVVGNYKKFLSDEGDSVNIRMLDALTFESHTYSLLNNYERAVKNYAPMASIAYQLNQQTSKKEMVARYQSLQEHDRLHRRNVWLLTIIFLLLGILMLGAIILWYRHRALRQNAILQQTVNRVSAYQKAAIKTDEFLKKQQLSVPDEIAPSSTEAAADANSRVPKPAGNEVVEDQLLFVELDKRVTRDKLFLNPDFSREDLMRLIGVDKNRIGRIMKCYSDTSNISSYISQKRAIYASEYIKEHPEHTIVAVMEACGMSNTVTLNRAFKELYGMTPSEYRQHILAGDKTEEK